ncbi:YitT family protein [Fictibacillus sp. WQ 8-8]|uniref:YitT family protein n=1 Tax=Fictibacillus sp. WQ 8-8 TaxID=2938788 RepID=UPI0035C767DD
MHILNGGFIGLALLLNYTLGVKVGLTIIILSAPVFLLALRFDKCPIFLTACLECSFLRLLLTSCFPYSKCFICGFL